MKELLQEFFLELGMKDCAEGVSKAQHRFGIKVYCHIFKNEINKRFLIVSDERVEEMRKEFQNKLKGMK